ncbi:hypothetical protein FCIRC_10769 [Fusarium circinatum]|uniref:Uncharacterized protein n=1 Tax=Fusarium circinatum TaxID=48490 RepID=A0A8H5T2W5_FUSCI|nr:hypothetical protein FCIRC_10769 [Fusarium circinatum]
METIDARLRPKDWPYERKDEPPNSPLLYVHLTTFSDGAALAMSVPHVFADQGGLANIVKAWLTVIQGKMPPEMTGYKCHVLGEKKEESRLVFLPMQVVQNLRDKARERLDGKHVLASEISNGDIITAIFAKLARINYDLEYKISLSSTINLRDRIPELQGERGGGYVHNAVHYATSNFTMKPSTELDEIALQNRIAVTKALEKSDIKAGVSTLREIAKANQVMLICEPHHKLYSSSNWSDSWQGIDFTKAAPRSYDLSSHRKEMVVLGQSKTLKAPMRWFWCDFATPVKAMALVEKFFRWDPSLGILLEEMEYYGTAESRRAFKQICRLPLLIVFILIL